MNAIKQIIDTTDVEVIDGEPRVADLKIAEALEYSRPRDIRQLIEAHSTELEKFGNLAAQTAKLKEGRGRPTECYYLNEKQALYITAKSSTDKAADLTVVMVEVFAAYRKGELTPTTAQISQEDMREYMKALSDYSASHAGHMILNSLSPILEKLETGVGSSILEITHVSKKLEGQSITERLNSMQAQIDRMESRHHGVLIQAGKIKKAVDIILGQGKDLPYVNAA